MTESGIITMERSGAAVVLRIERAERMNALATEHMEELARRVRDADHEGATVIVITGAGRAFCTGADLSGTVDGSTADAAADVVRAITEARAAVIAAVNGPTAGAGVSIAVACDLVIAAESAFFLLPFLSLGLVPDGGATQLIAARIGAPRAARMAFGGERIPAATAEAWGLVSEVVPDDRLDARIGELLDRILDVPDAAVAETARLLRAGANDSLATALEAEVEVQRRLLDSDEFRLAREGFLEKRPVSFRRD
ncbi:enoyl-CoA hydratase/isomerase family protein [Agromyces sp. NPDC058484]|uniref:enoyl-CoA hydratase/isomerase family protein n=1 Tax=Agromyces sp. NPDC058484 TaxID=3346524 RepID=UPI0036473224